MILTTTPMRTSDWNALWKWLLAPQPEGEAEALARAVTKSGPHKSVDDKADIKGRDGDDKNKAGRDRTDPAEASTTPGAAPGPGESVGPALSPVQLRARRKAKADSETMSRFSDARREKKARGASVQRPGGQSGFAR